MLCLLVCLMLPSLAVAESVTRVVDGDTIIISSGQRISLHGIDAPDRNQPGGGDAWLALIDFLRDVDTIELRNQKANTAIVIAKRQDVGMMLLSRGLAWVTPQADPAVKASYQAAFRSGQANRRGIWSQPIPPWEFRGERSVEPISFNYPEIPESSPQPVIVEPPARQTMSVVFYATGGCVPCEQTKPHVIRATSELGIPLQITYQRGDAWRANVQVYPTTVIFQYGREVRRLVGPIDHAGLLQALAGAAQ